MLSPAPPTHRRQRDGSCPILPLLLQWGQLIIITISIKVESIWWMGPVTHKRWNPKKPLLPFPGQPSTQTCLHPPMRSPCLGQPMSKRRLVIPIMITNCFVKKLWHKCSGWRGPHQRGLELFAQVSKIQHQVLIGQLEECKSSFCNNSKNSKINFYMLHLNTVLINSNYVRFLFHSILNLVNLITSASTILAFQQTLFKIIK